MQMLQNGLPSQPKRTGFWAIKQAICQGSEGPVFALPDDEKTN